MNGLEKRAYHREEFNTKVHAFPAERTQGARFCGHLKIREGRLS